MGAKLTSDGFEIFEGVITDRERDELIAEMSKLPNRSRAGARHLMESEVIAKLARDTRLVTLAVQALDGTAVPFRVTLFEKIRIGKLACCLAPGYCLTFDKLHFRK